MRILLYSYFACLILGVLGVVPVMAGTVPIYFIDILAGVSLLWVMIKLLMRQLALPPGQILTSFCIFTAVAALSLLLTPISVSSDERFISSLYLLRLIAYFCIFLLVHDSKDTIVLCRLRIVGVILAALGWIQYFFYPNLRNLEYLGWDPHLQRIFSTYLDPNYFGLILVLSIILWWFTLKNVPVVRALGIAFLFLTLLFTHSRSSYLTLGVVMSGYLLLSRRWMIVAIMLLSFIVAIVLLPQPAGEGGSLLRVFTLEARLENWRMGMEMVRDYPLLGVGFDTLRYAKASYLPETIDVSSSNSGAGLDNSFLFVAATTGLVGLTAFLLFVYRVFRYTDSLGKIVLVAILTHSLFQNSFFFPWIMAWMWMVLGAHRDAPLRK